MKAMPGKQIKDYQEAFNLAFSEAGAEKMQITTYDLFASLIDVNKLSPEAQKSINAAVRARYRGNPTWSGIHWYVPVAKPGFDFRGTPRLIFDVQTYMVASGKVDTTTRDYEVSLIGPLGKEENIVLPMVLLQALLDNDLRRFAILARSNGYTTWDVPGFKPIEIQDAWLSQLSAVLKRKSVAAWLLDFGSAGESVQPLVVGTLLGMLFRENTPPPPVGQQSWTYDILVQSLQALAYTPGESKKMVEQTQPNLKAEMTLEAAVRCVLQYNAQGERL
jgi:hypothetical protein